MGREGADPQPLTHAPELRGRRFSLQSLSFRWLPLIDVLPIRVQRPGNSMLLNPRSQYPRRCPDRLLFSHPAVRISRGVIHHVHQTTSRPSFFKPRMETAIQLHQVAIVFPPLPALPVRFASAHAAPQPLRQHPASQRLLPHFQPILIRQMFRCQRRSKPLLLRSRVLLPDQPQHLPPEFLWLRSIRTSASAAMLQPFGSLLTIALPQPLRLPIAHLQHLIFAASTSLSVWPFTRPKTSARRNSLVLIAVLFNRTSPGGLSVGDISNGD